MAFAVTFTMVVALLPAVTLTVRWVARRPFGFASSTAGRLRWTRLTACLLPPLVLVGAQLVLLLGADASWDVTR